MVEKNCDVLGKKKTSCVSLDKRWHDHVSSDCLSRYGPCFALIIALRYWAVKALSGGIAGGHNGADICCENAF